MKKILAATGNKKKLVEFRQILEPMGFQVLSAHDVGGLPEVIEDANTFTGNAAKKACEVAIAKGIPCFSDDSGLCVEALNGAPGVHSARYGGEGLDDTDRCKLLLKELAHTNDRKAHFACVIAIADANGQLLGSGEGRCDGNISKKMTGEGGFGYDPLFIPEGHELSFAELGSEIKNSMSHRQRALQSILQQELFQQILKED